jgi:two-component system sensor histidine kinase BaeS
MSQGWGRPPRRRPPWWPEGEGWPPERRWGRRRPPFVWRIGCFLMIFIAFAAIAGSVLTALAGLVFGQRGFEPGIGPGPFVIMALLLVLIASAGVRGFRRMTRPMDSLVDAARRIEKGDYSVRVAEDGSPDLRSVARAFNSMSARLKATDEQRRSFLADVTHELRTPLSVIRGQAEGISDGLYPGDAEHVAPIVDAAHTLEGLVEDLRTLALTDAGSLVLNREPVEPASLVYDTLASFESKAEAANVTLAADVGDGIPSVDVDVQRMRSVIGNLVSNALRHTPAGGSVRVRVTSEGDRVTISITDTGEGIAPDLLPRVFERFVRGPGSTGSGLGLAIAHDIVTAHGGDIEIESKVGIGTVVRIKLRTAAAVSGRQA